MSDNSDGNWGDIIVCSEGLTLTRRNNGLLEITAINSKLTLMKSFEKRRGHFISHIGTVELCTQNFDSKDIRNMVDNIVKLSSNPQSTESNQQLQYYTFKNPDARRVARLSPSMVAAKRDRDITSRKRSREVQRMSKDLQQMREAESKRRMIQDRKLMQIEENSSRCSQELYEASVLAYIHHNRYKLLTSIEMNAIVYREPYDIEVKYGDKHIEVKSYPYRCHLRFNDRWKRWSSTWRKTCDDINLDHDSYAQEEQFNNAERMMDRQTLFESTYKRWSEEESFHIDWFAFVGLWEPGGYVNDCNYLYKALNYNGNLQWSLQLKEKVCNYRKEYYAQECVLMATEDKNSSKL